MLIKFFGEKVTLLPYRWFFFTPLEQKKRWGMCQKSLLFYLMSLALAFKPKESTMVIHFLKKIIRLLPCSWFSIILEPNEKPKIENDWTFHLWYIWWAHCILVWEELKPPSWDNKGPMVWDDASRYLWYHAIAITRLFYDLEHKPFSPLSVDQCVMKATSLDFFLPPIVWYRLGITQPICSSLEDFPISPKLKNFQPCNRF